MANTTIGFGVVLCAIGLFGYFGAATESPSPTALIPAGFGAVLIVCGILAYSEKWRKHAMHFASLAGLIGFGAGLSRLILKVNRGDLFSDDPVRGRAPRMIFLMTLICFIFVATCVASFISARRRRAQGSGGSAPIS